MIACFVDGADAYVGASGVGIVVVNDEMIALFNQNKFYISQLTLS